jgi:U3 small nucleolar ribonucleoprotein component
MGNSEEHIQRKIEELIRLMRNLKPNDRSEIDRIYAVTLTDLEKIAVYWQVKALEAKP